jgi:hypothetical protein
MDRFTFKQIMILVCTLAGLFLLFIGMLVGNISSVTTRVCEGDSPCKSYTVEVRNANIAGDALSELSERIITGIKQ